MTKRIFRSICLVAIAVFLASVLLFLGVLYDYFGDVQRSQLIAQTELAAQGVQTMGAGYFEGFSPRGCRVTWISAEGDVLYDSEADSSEMENHLAREEIREALSSGWGESSRYSATLMERALYCAKRLPDGSVLRLSVSQRTLLTLLLGMAQPIIIIIVISMALSLLLASRLSKRIVGPLNDLDLEEPLSNEGYEELSPLLRHLESQRRQIKLQAEELAQKQREFDAVTENMAEGIVLLSTRCTILGMNRAAMGFFGVDAGCVGGHILTLSRAPEMLGLKESLESGRRDRRVMDLSGGRFQLTLSPVRDEGGLSGAVLLVIDVTERERAEELRREFTANVSHELKTPLHTIAGCAELLAGGLVKDGDRMDFYRRIEREAQRMTALVEDILRLSHLDEGADDMKRERVDLYALAAETARSLSGEAEDAGVTIDVRGESAEVEGIPRLLESIVYNLTDNAVKYNRPGGSVTVSVAPSEGGVVLTVADTGIGIPPEHRERIFERFYRVDKSRSKELGGTGLGLAIVKHAALLHKAAIGLESTEGAGTTVTVTFPVN